MKKKIIRKISLIILAIAVLLSILVNISFADVGSFESYDSGGSSWDSSSSWDSDSSSSGGSGSFVFFGDFGSFIIFIIIVLAIGYFRKKSGSPTQYRPQNSRTYIKPEEQIISEIQEHDELFNKDEIIAWSKTLFVKLQQSWTKRDWAEIRTFETNSLFEQHKSQLQGYIDNNQINVMDRICVNYANLYDYRISGDKEILVIKLNSRMQDYIIDATTKKVLRGDPKIERTNSYLLTFERKLGVKTKPGTTEVNTTNCPNCGAPTSITSSGKCDYCGSVITTGEYNWCLSNLERA
jgi:hypothetical protein